MTEQQVEQQVKTVTVVKKRGEGRVEMEVPVNESGEVTWSAVRRLFGEFNIPYSGNNTKAVHPRTKTEFTTNSAVVVEAGETEGRVYLFPKDTKAGMDRSEMYATIRKHIEDFGEEAKQYYNSPTNYTRTPNAELAERISKSPYAKAIPGIVTESSYKIQLEDLRKRLQALEYENAELRSQLSEYEGLEGEEDPILREYRELEKDFSSEYDDENDW